MLTKSAFVVAAAAAAVADAVVHPVHMKVPPINTPAAPNQGFGPIGGRVDPTLLPTQNPNDYKLVLYISGDNGATWWDKMHTLYLVYLNDPDAGNSQMKGVPIHADWSWNMTQWCSPGAPTDGTSTLFRAYVLPYAYDTKWPEYQVEGQPIPASITSSSYGGIQVNRGSMTVTYYDAHGNTAADQTAVAEDGVGVAPISNVPVGPAVVSVTPSPAAASASATPSRSVSASSSIAASASGTPSRSASVSASWSTGASASATASTSLSPSTSSSPSASAAASQPAQANDGTTPNLRAGSGVESIAMGAAAVVVLVASLYAAAA